MVACLLCEKPTRLVLDLGETPLANELPDSPSRAEKFPLRLVQCTECRHLQIDHPIAPERLYRDGYPYVATTTPGNKEHFRRYAMKLQDRFRPRFVVDVGSNDGLFLSYFVGAKVLGVDPVASGPSPYIHELFSDETKLPDSSDLITCNNCFAHNADLLPLLRGVKKHLADKGVFVLEVAYAVSMLRERLFDLIYHEHVHHWTLGALTRFLRENGLEVFDAEEVGTHGGSLRVFAGHLGKHKAAQHLARMLGAEAMDLAGLVEKFPAKVANEKEVTLRLLRTIPYAVGVLGYPAKACTLLSYYGIGPDFRSVFDDNPKKIGKRTHFGQEILSTDRIQEKAPGYLFVCSWNYADELMRRWPGGRFLIPHPMRAQ